jgi:hypothetical protein
MRARKRERERHRERSGKAVPFLKKVFISI